MKFKFLTAEEKFISMFASVMRSNLENTREYVSCSDELIIVTKNVI